MAASWHWQDPRAAIGAAGMQGAESPAQKLLSANPLA
jgi:hypothetical protein